MEFVSILGVLLGLFAVFGGALLEGLHVYSLLQGTAALVVFGGTIGATLLSFPQQEVKRALRGLKLVFQPIDDDPRETIHEIAEAAALSRKEGVLAIEGIRESLKNPLFKRSIKYVIDGFEPQTVKEIMQAEIDFDFEQTESAAKVWEAAGGYAPTIGIIGAVLGLIHVMSGLKDASADLGSGIAVAFVATVYGVASANLLFIPIGIKIKRKAMMLALMREIVQMGVVGIQEGLNPSFLKEKMEVFVSQEFKKAKGKKK